MGLSFKATFPSSQIKKPKKKTIFYHTTNHHINKRKCYHILYPPHNLKIKITQSKTLIITLQQSFNKLWIKWSYIFWSKYAGEENSSWYDLAFLVSVGEFQKKTLNSNCFPPVALELHLNMTVPKNWLLYSSSLKKQKLVQPGYRQNLQTCGCRQILCGTAQLYSLP